jgi:hypothetical protein
VQINRPINRNLAILGLTANLESTGDQSRGEGSPHYRTVID